MPFLHSFMFIYRLMLISCYFLYPCEEGYIVMEEKKCRKSPFSRFIRSRRIHHKRTEDDSQVGIRCIFVEK